jgi:hypothetical protein
MTLLRLCLIAAAAILSGAILWASLEAPFFAGFGAVLANPWVVVSLIDLYAGFLFASVAIWLLEPDRRIAAVLILLTFVLGNVVTLIWLALRGLGALTRRQAPR